MSDLNIYEWFRKTKKIESRMFVCVSPSQKFSFCFYHVHHNYDDHHNYHHYHTTKQTGGDIWFTTGTQIEGRLSTKLSLRWNHHHHNYPHWALKNLPLCVFVKSYWTASKRPNKGKRHICDIHLCCCNLILKPARRRRRSSWNKIFHLNLDMFNHFNYYAHDQSINLLTQCSIK